MTTPTNFVTRSQWGSSFNYGNNTRMPSTCRGVALHWEGPRMGTFSHDLCDNKVRQIEDFHVDGRGWAGIAYNALVCPHGYVYEGRGIRYRNAANGDPTKNAAYFAVCYLGGQGDPFTDPAQAAFVRAVQWLRADGGAGDYVKGHRDLTATACPGDTIWGWLRAKDFGSEVVVKPTTAVWGQPATWAIGAVGSDVTKIGERIRVWWKHYGWGDPYEVGPGEPYSETDRAALSRLQVKWGYGDASADLERGGASDGFPGSLTFTKLASTPTATPAPELDPITIEVLLLPTAGYNGDGARGVTQWERNTRGLAALVNQHDPDWVGVTEMSNRDINPMRPLFDSLLPAYAREGGSDGRYVYRRKATTDHVADGWVQVSEASELNDDDKQAAWSVDEVAPGVRKGIIVLHTENQDGSDRFGANKGVDADDLRVAQTLSALSRCYAEMKPHGVTMSDIIYIGDFNSESMVKNALVERGWKAVGPGYFTRWDDSARKTYDWGFIRAGVATAEVINHDFGDHTALRITWKTPR
jgi:hypothetical protein